MYDSVTLAPEWRQSWDELLYTTWPFGCDFCSEVGCQLFEHGHTSRTRAVTVKVIDIDCSFFAKLPPHFSSVDGVYHLDRAGYLGTSPIEGTAVKIESRVLKTGLSCPASYHISAVLRNGSSRTWGVPTRFVITVASCACKTCEIDPISQGVEGGKSNRRDIYTAWMARRRGAGDAGCPTGRQARPPVRGLFP